MPKSCSPPPGGGEDKVGDLQDAGAKADTLTGIHAGDTSTTLDGRADTHRSAQGWT
uniref:Uncharacterized protein n=1 Tax=Peronospora matthiolae TaxID=2874970 RepID=A0AAV1V224_9STRA